MRKALPYRKKLEARAGTPKEEQPASNPINSSLFYKVYIPDLLADLVLIAFGFFVSENMFSTGGLFYQLEPWKITAMYGTVVLTLPWYLGYLYERNSYYYRKGFMKLTLWVFVLITFVVLVHLVRLVFISDWIEDELGGINAFMAVFACFLLVLGPMMCIGGAASAAASFRNDGSDEEFDPGNATTTGALMVIVLAIAFMILIIGQFPENSGFGVVMLGFFGGPFLAVICFGLFLAFLSLLNKIGIYKHLAWLAKNAFPFLIVSVLVFWTGVAIHFMMKDFGTGGKVSGTAMLFTLLASGLIPFRIIMLFNAPVRITNIIIGICSLGYFLFQMLLLTK